MEGEKNQIVGNINGKPPHTTKLMKLLRVIKECAQITMDGLTKNWNYYPKYIY